MEPDLFLKQKKMGQLPRRFYLWLNDAQGLKPANPFLLQSWKKRIRHINVPFIDFNQGLFRNIYKCPRIFHDIEPLITAVDDTGLFGKIQNDWGSRPPVIGIEPEWNELGEKALRELGIPLGAWFACLHCREAGFHRYMPGQFFRNAEIETYLDAARWVVEQGGYVVRIGDPSMTPLPKEPGLVDYAHSQLKSGWLDLYLGATCRYFIGSGSGPASIAPLYGKPMSMANNLPLSATTFYCHNQLGLATPKLLRRKSDGVFLTFKQQLESPIGNYRSTELYHDAGLEWVNNDAQDILEMTRELHSLASDNLQLDKKDKQLQARIKGHLKPGHYGYQSNCLFSPAFLRRYEHLIG